jgi:Ribonuclease G/E
MKLTKKKKMLIASAAIRDIQILSVAMLQYKPLLNDLKPFIRDVLGEDATKSLYNGLANLNHVNITLNEIYKADRQAEKYLNDTEGLTHIEEISTQVLEKMNEVIANYKV